MAKRKGVDELVKCEFHDTVFYISDEVLAEVLLRMPFKGRSYYRYNEAAELYGIRESKMKILSKEAEAVRKPDGVALDNIHVMDQLWRTVISMEPEIYNTSGMVKCEFHRNTFYITNEVLSEVLIRMQLRGRNLYSYTDAALLYGVSESKIRILAKKACAIRKQDGSSYVDSAIMDDFISGK